MWLIIKDATKDFWMRLNIWFRYRKWCYFETMLLENKLWPYLFFLTWYLSAKPADWIKCIFKRSTRAVYWPHGVHSHLWAFINSCKYKHTAIDCNNELIIYSQNSKHTPGNIHYLLLYWTNKPDRILCFFIVLTPQRGLYDYFPTYFPTIYTISFVRI